MTKNRFSGFFSGVLMNLVANALGYIIIFGVGYFAGFKRWFTDWFTSPIQLTPQSIFLYTIAVLVSVTLGLMGLRRWLFLRRQYKGHLAFCKGMNGNRSDYIPPETFFQFAFQNKKKDTPL